MIKSSIATEEIHIRDPFVFADVSSKTYYLYGTNVIKSDLDANLGFLAYKSGDLKTWKGPFNVFSPPQDFWATKNYWAPEVYDLDGKFYMFASFKSEERCRGTQILKSKSPLGPFKPISDLPVTPCGWECLDGTLYIDQSHQPWIIFCREWLEVKDGAIYACQLEKDFGKLKGTPTLLFTASAAPWTSHVKDIDEAYITDGPFIQRTKSKLLMIWSSLGSDGYATGVSCSVSGNIQGPWWHYKEPIYSKNGGHGMIFKTFERQLFLSIHQPNDFPNERPIFIPLNLDEYLEDH